ncbi:cytochrome c oxidase assembly protein COX18, mitochondrial-like [Mercenaria mercenaria]|uniref:cytochrome c oxidase assembly protein COX18, mitochondrial-like n=1 Tax=Mercenaria mercenaria TaxID=6596 RepID=UPI00234E9BF1|nr:cytochrome c oxidase assembly protein COX18, mitochondrial-like [Mercenaria mercenaria]
MLYHGRHIKTSFHRLSSCLSKTWQRSSLTLQHINTDDVNRRKYSGLSSPRSGLQLQKSPGSPLYLAESKRHIEYNLFYLLIQGLEYQFLFVKSMSGLNWCATIVLCTMPYRAALAWFLKKKTAEQMYANSHVNENLLPALQKKELKKFNSGKYKHLNEKERKKLFTKNMKYQQKRLYEEHKINAYAILIYGASPLPFWIANSLAIRGLSGAQVPHLADIGALCPDMQTGGILWFQNLFEADPYHILPVLTSLSFLATIELSVLSQENYGKKSLDAIQNSFSVKGLNFFVRGWCICTVYIFWNLPAAVTWYWCTSGITMMIVNLGMLHPEIQRRLTPPNVHERINENPYRTVLNNMNKRYNPKNWFLPK